VIALASGSSAGLRLAALPRREASPAPVLLHRDHNQRPGNRWRNHRLPGDADISNL